MLKSLKEMYRAKLGASDGSIGHVKDFYFDDQNWVIRYLIADAGSWLPGRQVLISPHAVGRFNQAENILLVNLTREQIENSPLIETHKPVSRQYEEDHYRYYGWPNYWQGGELWGMSGSPMLHQPEIPISSETVTASGPQPEGADAHLRSAQAVNGYQIKAGDGKVGHICDLLMDAQSWAIRQLVIKIGRGMSGRDVQIPTSNVDRISYEESTVFVNMNSEAVGKSPPYGTTLTR